MTNLSVLSLVPANVQPTEVGAILQQVREQRGMTPEQAAAHMKVPTRVVDILESGHWEELSALVFIRGHLRNYAKFLAVDITDYLDHSLVQSLKPVELIALAPQAQPTHRRLNVFVRPALYAVIVLFVIVVPVWVLFGRVDADGPKSQITVGSETLRVDEVPQITTSIEPPVIAQPLEPVAINAPAEAAVQKVDESPVVTESPFLQLSFNAESWVEIKGRDGKYIERDLLSAGATRTFQIGQIASVKLGNARAVQVQKNGEVVNLAPFERANVASFAVSSDGSLTRVKN